MTRLLGAMEFNQLLSLLMVQRSFQGPTLGRSKSGIVRLPTPTFPSHCFYHVPCPTCPAAGSLELKSEKKNAHSGEINSVAFSPDGKTIGSGSYDKTLKVWDCAAAISNIFLLQHFPHVLPPSVPQPHLWSSRQR